MWMLPNITEKSHSRHDVTGGFSSQSASNLEGASLSLPISALCTHPIFVVSHEWTFFHGDVIKWKHFPPGHRWIPLTKASDAELWFFLICAWINSWVNNREAVDLGPHRTHYAAIVMSTNQTDKQRVLMHGHQGWNVRHGLCHIYMRYVYIYELFIAFVSFVVCSLL